MSLTNFSEHISASIVEGIHQQILPTTFLVRILCFFAGTEIVLDPRTNESRMRDTTSGQDLGHPSWLAGTIAQVPAEEVSVKDLLKETAKRDAINVSRLRVECFPDPDGSAKGLSRERPSRGTGRALISRASSEETETTYTG